MGMGVDDENPLGSEIALMMSGDVPLFVTVQI
jgi:hypothetical protein